MADHGYLELEGGQSMIEFIVRQCALPADPVGPPVYRKIFRYKMSGVFCLNYHGDGAGLIFLFHSNFCELI